MRASNQSSRRKPRRHPPFVVALATGAALAGVVVAGGFGIDALLAGSGVVQLDTAGEGPGEDLVDQLLPGEPGTQAPDNAPGTTPGGPLGGGLMLPEIPDLPELDISALLERTGTSGSAGTGGAASGSKPQGTGGSSGATAPDGSSPNSTATSPHSGSSSSSPSGSSPSAVPCPTVQAPTTVEVNTVYPGGGAANTVALDTGTVRAVRAAFGPCAAQTVDLAVADGMARGSLGYGAWILGVVGSSPAGEWPIVVVSSAGAASATANVAGNCPTATHKVRVTASNKPLLGLLGTPWISGTVTATRTPKNVPCQSATSVEIDLGLLGEGSAQLPAGTWTFAPVGRTLLGSTPSSVVLGGAGTKSVALVVG